MDNRKMLVKYENLKNAFIRLNDVINNTNRQDYYRDAVIQRFEFTFELLWKTLKEYLIYKGFVDLNSPRDVLKKSFEIGIISNEEVVEIMLYDRNLTSHMYNEETAVQVYNNIVNNYINEIKQIIEKIGDLN